MIVMPNPSFLEVQVGEVVLYGPLVTQIVQSVVDRRLRDFRRLVNLSRAIGSQIRNPVASTTGFLIRLLEPITHGRLSPRESNERYKRHEESPEVTDLKLLLDDPSFPRSAGGIGSRFLVKGGATAFRQPGRFPVSPLLSPRRPQGVGHNPICTSRRWHRPLLVDFEQIGVNVEVRRSRRSDAGESKTAGRAIPSRAAFAAGVSTRSSRCLGAWIPSEPRVALSRKCYTTSVMGVGSR
jgi:hypothetical protein